MAEKQQLSKREIIKEKNKKLHKKLFKSPKVRAIIIAAAIILLLYLFGTLGFIEINEEKVDSILDRVEAISEQITDIKEMISSEKDSEDEQDTLKEQSQTDSSENNENLDKLEQEQ